MVKASHIPMGKSYNFRFEIFLDHQCSEDYAFEFFTWEASILSSYIYRVAYQPEVVFFVNINDEI